MSLRGDWVSRWYDVGLILFVLVLVLLASSLGCQSGPTPQVAVVKTWAKGKKKSAYRLGTGVVLGKARLLTVDHVVPSGAVVWIKTAINSPGWHRAMVVRRTRNFVYLAPLATWDWRGWKPGDSGSPVYDDSGQIIALHEGRPEWKPQ